MSQRESGYERKERDLYETPAWVTEALRSHIPRTPALVWEPACGSGKMSSVIAGWGVPVVSSDIEPTPLSYAADFLNAPTHEGADAIITNPPYEAATDFCFRALNAMRPALGFVAMLLRTDFDHARSRSQLFGGCDVFAKKLVLTRRIAWFVEADGKPRASPSFNHAWYIWDWRHEGPPSIAYGPT